MIAVIDDDELIRTSLELVLQSNGYAVTTAATPDQVTVDGLSLIIADYRLGDGRTGLDAVVSLRQRTRADLPCLILSGDTSPNLRTACTGLGLTLLIKPVNAVTLISAVQSLLSAHPNG